MTATDDRAAPTIAERYASAVKSSTLKLKPNVVGPLDIVIAMGWCGDGIGAVLHRLRSEWDSIHGQHRLAAKNLRAAQQKASRVSAATKQAGSERMAELAELISQEAEKEALIARALIMLHLKSLFEAKQMLGKLAVIEATRIRFMRADAVAAYLAGRCLDVWLDPTCPSCEGRGFNGAGRHEQSGPIVHCRPCRASGGRAVTVGKDDDERRFAGHILGLMGDALTAVERGMSRKLGGR